MARRRTTTQTVVFTLDAPASRGVSIVGTFSSWEPLPLSQDEDGLWRITLRLAQGSYEYKFLVDAAWWTDPNNPHQAPNEYGSYNSICEV